MSGRTSHVIATVFALWTLSVTATNAAAANYYINSEIGDDANDGSKERPWKTPWRVAWTDLQPGDAIYFARGQKWVGGFAVDSNGTKEAPILISAYGEGDAPILSNPNNKNFNGNCIRIRGDYITIEKLHFAETSDAVGEGVNIFELGAVYIAKGADHVRIQDCTFTDCPKGINIFGQYSTVTRNYFRNKGRPLRPQSWGPIAICIQSSNHEFSYNTFLNHIGPSRRYNWDGGVFEVDIRTESADNVWIHHNRSIGNCGFIENEFWELGGRTRNWVIAYNVIDDYQWFIDLGPTGDSIIAHNTISIREHDPKCPYHFFMDPKFRRNSGIYYNNIFVSYGGADLSAIPAKLRKHNLFYSMDGKTDRPGGAELGKGDKIAEPMFVDAANHDFRLKSGSPAIDAGIDVGLTHDLFKTDIEGNPAPAGGARDIGAYEFQRRQKN